MEDYEEYIEQHNNIANYYNDINVENNIKNIMNKLNYSHNDIQQDNITVNEEQDNNNFEPITINDLDFSSCEKNKGKNNKESKVYYYKDFK